MNVTVRSTNRYPEYAEIGYYAERRKRRTALLEVVHRVAVHGIFVVWHGQFRGSDVGLNQREERDW